MKEPKPRFQAITDLMTTVFKVVSGSGGPRLGRAAGTGLRFRV